MKTLIFSLFCLLTFASSFAQNDIDLINLRGEENELENQEEWRTQNALFFNYKDTSLRNWNRFKFLDADDLKMLQVHFTRYGMLYSKFELMAVEGLKKETVLTLLQQIDEQMSVLTFQDIAHAQQSQLELVSRAAIKLPIASGFTKDRFDGSALQSYHRMRMKHGKNLDMAVITEKDAGEKMLHGPYGNWAMRRWYFDYKNGGILQHVCIGDIQANYGTGLIYGPAFARGPSQVQLLSNSVLGNRSVSENGHLTGLATSLNFGSFKSTLILAKSSFSANIDESGNVSSFYESGLFRNGDELSKKNMLKGYDLGLVLRKTGWGLLVRHREFDRRIQAKPSIWNVKRFQGNTINQMGLFWQQNLKGVFTFGEFAMDHDRSCALNASFQFNPDTRTSFNVNYHFQSPSWYRGSSSSDLDIMLHMKLAKKINLSFFAQNSEPLWLRYLESDFTSRYKAWLKIEKSRRKDYELALQSIMKVDDKVNQTAVRFQYLKHFSQLARWKLRAEWKQFESNGLRSAGRSLFTETKFNHQKIHLSWIARFTIFDADDYANRFLAYENNVLYSYSVTSLQQKGLRQSLLLTYKPSRLLRLSIKAARTVYATPLNLGAGVEQRVAKVWHEIAIQLQLKV